MTVKKNKDSSNAFYILIFVQLLCFLSRQSEQKYCALFINIFKDKLTLTIQSFECDNLISGKNRT